MSRHRALTHTGAHGTLRDTTRIPDVTHHTSPTRHAPAVAHDSHDGVLSGRQLLEVNELDCLRLHHGLLRIHQVVHQGVDAVTLVPRDRSCRQTGKGSQTGQRLDEETLGQVNTQTGQDAMAIGVLGCVDCYGHFASNEARDEGQRGQLGRARKDENVSETSYNAKIGHKSNNARISSIATARRHEVH